MMAVTHAMIAAAGTSLILGTASPMTLGLAVLGSQLPDLDTTTSTIGKIFFPISSWIEDRSCLSCYCFVLPGLYHSST